MKHGLLIFLVAVLAGCATQAPVQTLRFHEQVAGNLPASHVRQVVVPITRQHLAVDPEPTLSERDVVSAKLEPSAGGDAILLKFDAHGANLLAEMTTRLRGRSLVVLVNDRPVAAVLIEHAIASGELLLTGDLTDEETQTLVDSLNKVTKRKPESGTPKPEP